MADMTPDELEVIDVDENINADEVQPVDTEYENVNSKLGSVTGKFKSIPKGAGKLLKKFSKKQLILFGVILALIIAAGVFGIVKANKVGKIDLEYETAKVERQSISRTVDGSSMIEANDTYDVTALVTGEILTDTFNEGDVVTKDSVLYTIESSDVQNKVTQAENSLTQARQNFTDAVKKRTDTIKTNGINKSNTQDSVRKALNSVETAQKNYNNLTLKSDYTGRISEVLVDEGDSVGDGTKIAKIENTSQFKMQIPFNEADAAAISVGDTAEVTVASSGDKLYGTVTNVASSKTTTAAHAIVRYVTIKVDNPGALNVSERASAVINGVACSDLGTFEYMESGYITAKTSGKVGALYIDENDYITNGQTVGYLTSDSVVTSYDNAKMELDSAYRSLEKVVIETDTYSLDSSVNSAKISLENAEMQLEDAQKSLDDYTIKAPIDGTIVTKNKKAGEKLEQNNSQSEPMAVIYDMSQLKVSLTIDESEIHDIVVGQRVTITADAVEGIFEGEVIKVGIEGTSLNGVTTYPVEIAIAEYGDLLPGMNVDCVIEIEAADDVLAVPVSAIQRGNTVYVEGKKEDDNDMAPDGYRSVKVETGITDSSYIEITDGISEGDTIITSVKPSGIEAIGETEDSSEDMMGGMMGGMPGGGMSGGGMPGGGGRMSGGGGGMPGGGMR